MRGELDAKVVALLFDLDGPACRRLLALAWVAYSTDDDEPTLRGEVKRAYEGGAITAEQIISEWVDVEVSELIDAEDDAAGDAWFGSSCGLIELRMTKAQAASGHHQGRCDDDVLALSRDPDIAHQLGKIDAAVLREELRRYGAWNAEELADHEQNLQRILWLACGDICDQD